MAHSFWEYSLNEESKTFNFSFLSNAELNYLTSGLQIETEQQRAGLLWMRPEIANECEYSHPSWDSTS